MSTAHATTKNATRLAGKHLEALSYRVKHQLASAVQLEDAQEQTVITPHQLRSLSVTAVINYRFCLRAWHMVVASLPVDLLLFLVLSRISTTGLPTEFVDMGLVLLLAAGLLVSSRDLILNILLRAQGFHSKFESSSQTYGTTLKLIIAVVLVADMARRAYEVSVWLSALVATLALFVLPWWLRMVSQSEDYRREQRTLYTQRAATRFQRASTVNQQIRVTVLLSIGLIRIIPLFAAVSLAFSSQSIWVFLLYLVTTLVLLIAAMPQREDFLIPCKRCASLTTRAFKNTFSCPRCESKRYRGDWAERMRKRQKSTSGIPAIEGFVKSLPDRIPDFLSVAVRMARVLMRKR